MSAGAPIVLLGPRGERPFDAPEIERELRAMWKTTSNDHGPLYRAAMANLVVPVEGPLRERLGPVLAEVARRHPSRLIEIEPGAAEAGDPERLLARATALCHVRPGGGMVCSEQIRIEWSARSAALLPSAVQALLVGDLPTVLLAIEPGPTTPWLAALGRIADLVIRDSAIERDPRAMARFWDAETGNGRATRHDLAWARLAPWRSLLAEAFDRPEAGRAIRSLQEVAIFHGGAAPPAGAWLLAGWLAARLGWTPRSAGPGHVRFDAPTRPVTVAFLPEEDEPGAVIRRVRVRAGDPTPLDVSIEHRGHDPVAHETFEAPVATTRAVTFAYRDLAASIVGEIHRHEPNRAFADAARAAEELIALWPSA
ncbi:MAG: glucose-6-phosphate dehydrogenase assembly protein OpcA [Hyphomicrobiales bacterium]